VTKGRGRGNRPGAESDACNCFVTAAFAFAKLVHYKLFGLFYFVFFCWIIGFLETVDGFP